MKTKVPTRNTQKLFKNSSEKFTDYYIDYEDKTVYLIKLNNKGNTFQIQYAGCSCLQYKDKGFLIGKFKSNHKYFNPNYWYKYCSWFHNRNLLYFKDTKNHKQVSDAFSLISLIGKDDKQYLQKSELAWQKAYKEADKYTIPSEKVLDEILNIASKKLKLELKSFGCIFYERDWAEAYIPVYYIKNDKLIKCILTWQNCD